MVLKMKTFTNPDNNATKAKKEFNITDQVTKPLIPADISEFWTGIIEPILFNMIEKNFYAVRIKNRNNYYSGNQNYAKLLYGVHTCYYDGQAAYYFCKKAFNSRFHLMIEQLYRFPLLSKLGAFSIEKDTPYDALKSLNYAAHLLRNKNNTVWIFPQGRVMPCDHKPIKFEKGIAYISNKAKKVNIIPVAVKYTFVRNEKPEIFVEFGTPVVLDNGTKNKKELTEHLEIALSELMENQANDISNGIYDGYEYIYMSRETMFRKLEHLFKNLIYDKRYLAKKCPQ